MKNLLNSMFRNFRFAVSLIALMSIFATSMYAQGNQPGMGRRNATPEERAKRQTDRMKDDLKLTATQEPKVLAINLKYANKIEDVRKIADTAAQRKAVMNINKQKEAELKGVLTAEQLKGYQKEVEEMMARRRQMQH